MDKKTIEQFKERLEKEKKQIEKQLKTFADKDKNVKGDWDTRFPKWNGGSGGSALETAADAVEEYSSLLPIEHNLELRLQNINNALENIKRNTYGFCEKCKKPIPADRLKVYPEARLCIKCK
ncbi:MAG: TraR/DksA family transcriptional regulator [Candidatus Nealsonbacteria bacterium]